MNESAGTEMGPMEERLAHVFADVRQGTDLFTVTASRKRAFDELEANVKNVIAKSDAEIRTLTASRDRLADALRDYRNTFLRLGMYGVANEINGLLTDIPDCPHAQRVDALEAALRKYGMHLRAECVNGKRECVCGLVAALTASTGEEA